MMVSTRVRCTAGALGLFAVVVSGCGQPDDELEHESEAQAATVERYACTDEELDNDIGMNEPCTGSFRTTDYLTPPDVAEAYLSATARYKEHPNALGLPTIIPVDSEGALLTAQQLCAPAVADHEASLLAGPAAQIVSSTSSAWLWLNPTSWDPGTGFGVWPCRVHTVYLTTVATGPAYTLPGLTRQEAEHPTWIDNGGTRPVPAGRSFVCSTCDDVPGTGAKHDCLQRELGLVSTITASSATLGQAPIVAQSKRLFEFRGTELTSGQREQARDLYRAYPEWLPTTKVGSTSLVCGRSSGLPYAAHCEDLEPGRWQLEFCARLSSTHVPSELLMDFEPGRAPEVTACAGYFDSIAQLAEASTCDAQPYVDATVDVMDQQFDRVLDHFELEGDRMLDLDQRARFVQLQAEVLRIFDDYAAALRSVQSDDELAASELQLLQRFRLRAEAIRRLRQPYYDLLLSNATEQSPPGSTPEDLIRTVDYDRILETNELWTALSQTLTRSDAMDQDLFRSAFADARGDGRPALRSDRLLTIVGDVLAPMAGRLDMLGEPHDIACAFLRCRAPGTPNADIVTPVSGLWSLMAAIDDDRELPARAAELAALVRASAGNFRDPNDPAQGCLDPTSPCIHLNGWEEAFAAATPFQSELTDAIRAHLPPGWVGPPGFGGYAPGDLANVDDAALPASVKRFLAAARTARARTAAFHNSGFFALMGASSLYTSMEAAKRDDIADYIDGKTDELEQRLHDYDRVFLELMHQIMADSGNRASIVRLEARIDEHLDELEELSRQRDAHSIAAASGATFAELARSFVDVEGAFDGQSYMQIGSAQLSAISPLSVTGADARFRGARSSVPSIAVAGPLSLDGGEILSLHTSGVYAPTCALRAQGEVLKPNENATTTIDVTGAFTGPEGYTVTWTGSSYEADSATDIDTFSGTVGVKLEACTNSGLFGDLAGLEWRACGYADAHYNRTWSGTDTDGTDSRTSASFTSGLRLRNTPFPVAPVGALLAVELPRGETSFAAIRDVHPIRAPYTAVPVRGDSDLYLVVNDLQPSLSTCGAAGSFDALTVELTKLAGTAVVSRQLLARIAQAIEYLRDQERALVAQGTILPGVGAQLRSDAELAALSGFPGIPMIPVADYPAPLRLLWEAFINRELARLEHAVHVANLDRRIDVVVGELNATSAELRSARASGEILSALPLWSVRNLDADYLFEQTFGLGAAIRDYGFPVIDLWYPDAARALATDADLAWILNMPPNAPVREAASRVVNVGRRIADGVVIADLRNRATITERRLVAVSFRRPDSAATDPGAFAGAGGFGPGGFGPTAGFSEFVTADPVRARALWDGIEAADLTNLQILPEDIYRNGGNHILSCTRALPVLRNVGIVFAGPIVSQGSNVDVWADGEFDPIQPFLGQGGAVSFRLDNGYWTPLQAALVYANTNEVIAKASDVMGLGGNPAREPEGMSPFAIMHVDFRLLDDPAIPAGLTNAVATANEVVVVMELESVSVPPPYMNWVSTCH